MATNDELVTRLRNATDRLAEKVRRLSEGDPRFEPIIAELEAMGVDETNPVPEPTPDTGTGTGTGTDEIGHGGSAADEAGQPV
jgi:hypothetical protein